MHLQELSELIFKLLAHAFTSLSLETLANKETSK